MRFEIYDLPDIEMDEKEIMRGTSHIIAWFKDRASNLLSVLNQARGK